VIFLKRLQAKPRRSRKSIILTMKYVLDIHEDNDDEAKRIGKMFIAWMRDKFSNWDDSVLEYFLYENNIEQNSDDDRLYLEGHLDKILKDDCTHMEDREIEEDNLLNYNKDTSSSESTAKPEIEE
jgi:hypothetical protein